LSKPLDSRTISEGIRLLKADTALISNIRESEEVMRHISDIRLINKAKTMLMKYQKFTFKNYVFRHHLETSIENSSLSLRGLTWRDFRSSKGLDEIVKVRINHIGQIVSVGEG
jgi:hypothetical protein